MLALFPSKKLKKQVRSYGYARIFLNSLQEKIAAHSGLTYLIRFTYLVFIIEKKMKLKKYIPPHTRLQYKLGRRLFNDIIKGCYFKFANKNHNKGKFEHFIKITQPIRKSYLFENKIHNLRLACKKSKPFL